MSREVAYGLNFTATDKMTPVLGKIEDSAQKTEEALGDLTDTAEKLGDAAVPALEGVADAAEQAKAAAEAMGKAAGPALKGLEDQAKKTRKSKKQLGDTAKESSSALGAVKDEAAASTSALASMNLRAAPVGTALAGIAVAATAGAIAVVKFGQALAGWAGAAAKVEAIEIRTLSAIRERADFTDQEFEALRRLNAERERTLGIDADAQMQLQGTLASMGVHKDQLDAATEATIGLSTATGHGLNEAARVVAKSLAGNTGALQEYGIKVSSVQEAQAKFAQMFAVAAAQADTYGSRVQALRHSWDGFFEAIGHVITQSPEVKQSLSSVTDAIVNMTAQLGPGSAFAQNFGATLSMMTERIGSIVEQVSTPPGRDALANFFTSSVSAAQSLASILPTVASAIAGIADRTANWLRVREQVGILGMTFMGKQEVEEYGRELRAQDQKTAEARKRDAEELMGILTPAGGDGLGGLGTRAPAPKPFAIAGGGQVTQASKPSVKPKDMAPEGETWDQFTARMRKANALAREAAAIRGNYLAEQERENQQRVLEIQAAYQDKQEEQRQSALEATAEAAREQAEGIRSFLESIGTQAISIFSDAFASIGRLQNETTTEIVRNEEGMLEERTRITGQYIQTVGGALKQFLGDSATMFVKAALHQVAVIAVVTAAEAMKNAFGSLGLLAFLAAPALAGAAYAMVKAGSSKVPPPPKFHTGGVVPGVPGRERMALLQSGERVSSVADTADGRGGAGGGITINNNLLVAPSRVQVERVNRDVLLPSARRLQRLGFAG